MTKYIVMGLSLVLLIALFFEFRSNAENSNDTANCPLLTGRVVYRGDPGYEKGRLVSNYYNSKEKFPYVIVYAKNEKDVQNAILWARCKNFPIRIRSGGHNHEGFSTGTGVILIDVSEMKSLEVNRESKTAKIGPGLNNLELYTRLYKEGLTHAGGTCSEVGLSGLVLSGGIGPLLRKAGLTCDTLLSVDIVDAGGRILHATKDNEYKDLFWATCGGGGGNFGAIVSMEIKLYPAEDVTWFNIGWDWEQPVEEVVNAWQKFFGEPNDKWFSHLDVWAKTFPIEKLKKQPVKVLGMYFGPVDEAKKQLNSFLSIGKPSTVMIESVTWDKATLLIEESTAVFLTDKPEYKSSGAYAMENLPKEALDIMTKTLKESKSPLLNVLIFSMGGASSEIPPEKTAYFYRNAKFFLNYSIQWLESGQDEVQQKELADLRNSLLPYTEGDYVGNPDPDIQNYLKAYYGDNSKKLMCIKRKYDPDNIFQYEQSIPLAPKGFDCP